MSNHVQAVVATQNETLHEEKVRIFPAHIPVEILRYILEIAATLDRNITARAIVLSSKLLRSWIDPILHRNVILHSSKNGAAFTASIKARQERDPTFFQRRVKLLAVGLNVLAEDITFVLGVCTGVSTLHIWILLDEETEEEPCTAFDTSTLEHVLHFSCNFVNSGHIPFLPKSLTHLLISFGGREEALELDWQNLFRHCTALTHLLIVLSVETSTEMTAFLEDGTTVDIARPIFRARTAEAGPLTVVFIPRALLVVSLAHVPVDWIHEWRKIKDSDRFLIVHPRRVIDEIPDDELTDNFIVAAQLDLVNRLAIDDAYAACYFMNQFPSIHCDVWDFVEHAKRAPLPSSLDAHGA